MLLEVCGKIQSRTLTWFSVSYDDIFQALPDRTQIGNLYIKERMPTFWKIYLALWKDLTCNGRGGYACVVQHARTWKMGEILSYLLNWLSRLHSVKFLHRLGYCSFYVIHSNSFCFHLFLKNESFDIYSILRTCPNVYPFTSDGWVRVQPLCGLEQDEEDIETEHQREDYDL